MSYRQTPHKHEWKLSYHINRYHTKLPEGSFTVLPCLSLGLGVFLFFKRGILSIICTTSVKTSRPAVATQARRFSTRQARFSTPLETQPYL